MSDEGQTLYTIGHSNLDMETLLGYLRRYDITTVVDIRSRARSRITRSCAALTRASKDL